MLKYGNKVSVIEGLRTEVIPCFLNTVDKLVRKCRQMENVKPHRRHRFKLK